LRGTENRIEKDNDKNSSFIANFNVNDDMSYDNAHDLRKNHFIGVIPAGSILSPTIHFDIVDLTEGIVVGEANASAQN
jgi:hypothetical protein